ncbi:hypothetical protein ED312_03545 [Sinomicrobium pectinilyticum]|uniref:Transposase DDE domain-containing protein n=1 Tax=Sinomicrobium pectinilyticum TaxID=1084421 RepID=A0A3N0EXQ1_SINP1|nr:hypothetical protein ED312_03545 [Sinomicrobium pectinilyticum]
MYPARTTSLLYKQGLAKPRLKRDTTYQRRKKRKHHRRRAAIEPVIGHLKTDHRVARNFLKGQVSNSINFIMAAAGFNFKKLIVKLQQAKRWLCSQIHLVNTQRYSP